MPTHEPIRRTLVTRALHGALLLAVGWQLLGSNFIERPRAARPGNAMYEWHEIGGLITLGLVMAFWLWSMLRRRETPFAALFPWLSPRRLKAVGTDLAAHWAALKRFHLPGGEAETPLASAVHGLGLLTALAMGASGAWLYTQAVPGGLVLELHKIVANLMWAYVVAHAGLAVLHQFAGHRVLQRMFARPPADKVGP
ncbi:MAG TPA: cytochrome b/b6 domain-containing protein [Burkholderiaceae bacterium]|nr:cytochrome b/b6 domain-containing protein [Burkholderiaceae bacterium]